MRGGVAGGQGSEGVEVLDEFAEAEGLSGEAEGGFKGFEGAGEGVVVGDGGGGEEDLGGVPRDLEELVHAVALGEVGFEVA